MTRKSALDEWAEDARLLTYAYEQSCLRVLDEVWYRATAYGSVSVAQLATWLDMPHAQVADRAKWLADNAYLFKERTAGGRGGPWWYRASYKGHVLVRAVRRAAKQESRKGGSNRPGVERPCGQQEGDAPVATAVVSASDVHDAKGTASSDTLSPTLEGL